MTILAAVVLASAPAFAHPHCPPGPTGAVQWRVEDGRNGIWYPKVAWAPDGTGPVWWLVAKQSAEEAGGQLATITSAAKNVWPAYQGSGYVIKWEACDLCPADINGDGAVDGADLAGVLNGWGPCP